MKRSVSSLILITFSLFLACCGKHREIEDVATETHPVAEEASKLPTSETQVLSSPSPSSVVTPTPSPSPTNVPATPPIPTASQLDKIADDFRDALKANSGGSLDQMQKRLLSAYCQLEVLEANTATASRSAFGLKNLLSKIKNRAGSLFQKQKRSNHRNGADDFPKLKGASRTLQSNMARVCKNPSLISSTALMKAGLTEEQWHSAIADLATAARVMFEKLR